MVLRKQREETGGRRDDLVHAQAARLLEALEQRAAYVDVQLVQALPVGSDGRDELQRLQWEGEPFQDRRMQRGDRQPPAQEDQLPSARVDVGAQRLFRERGAAVVDVSA